MKDREMDSHPIIWREDVHLFHSIYARQFHVEGIIMRKERRSESSEDGGSQPVAPHRESIFNFFVCDDKEGGESSQLNTQYHSICSIIGATPTAGWTWAQSLQATLKYIKSNIQAVVKRLKQHDYVSFLLFTPGRLLPPELITSPELGHTDQLQSIHPCSVWYQSIAHGDKPPVTPMDKSPTG